MKKDVFLVCGVLFTIFLIAIYGNTKTYKPDIEPPPIVMINDIKYSGIAGVLEAAPKSLPDGYIEDVVDSGPLSNNQSNFGYAGMEYWILENGVVCIKSMKTIF